MSINGTKLIVLINFIQFLPQYQDTSQRLTGSASPPILVKLASFSFDWVYRSSTRQVYNIEIKYR